MIFFCSILIYCILTWGYQFGSLAMAASSSAQRCLSWLDFASLPRGINLTRGLGLPMDRP